MTYMERTMVWLRLMYLLMGVAIGYALSEVSR